MMTAINFISRTFIKLKSIFMLASVVIGFIIIGLTFRSVLVIGEEAQGNSMAVFERSLLLNEIEIALLKAKAADSDYLRTHDPMYITLHENNMQQAYALIEKLKANIAADEQLSAEIQQINNMLERYSDGFNFIVSARDSRDAMLEQFSQVAMEMENSTNKTASPVLINSMLKMRRYEKEFLATNNLRYAIDMNNEAKQFGLLLFDASLSDEDSTHLSRLANQYNVDFLGLTNGTKALNDRIAEFHQVVKNIVPLFDSLRTATRQSYFAGITDSKQMIQDVNTFFILTFAAVATVLIIMLLSMLRQVSHVFSRTMNMIGEISTGDLTQNYILGAARDEINTIIKALTRMQKKLTSVILNIRGGADTVSDFLMGMRQDNQHLSQRMQQQASSLEDIASSMEEMTTTVSNNAHSAQRASQSAKTAYEKAVLGSEVVERAILAMQEIDTASSDIAEIISVIDSIAFQTNLLALNAAVEAAHAGEQGKGFAVVAGEVRNLAASCKTAAKEIETLIASSVARIENGRQLVDESSGIFEEIMLSAEQVSDVIAGIASSSQQQSEGITQVSLSLQHVDELVQQNVLLVEKAASASEEVSIQGHELRCLLDYFTINDETDTSTNEAETKHVPEVVIQPEEQMPHLINRQLAVAERF